MKIHTCCFITLCLSLLAGAVSVRGQDNVLISEFMADNDRTLSDEDGDFPDWIEIYNAGTNTVNLLNWSLRDSGSIWLFPNTNIGPSDFMIIFASEKNRRTPGAPLHTNFRLSNEGENLGLFRSNGAPASLYVPFPEQVPAVSYGIAVQEMVTTLVAPGALAKVFVPADGSLSSNWLALGFNDMSWSNAVTGVGYEADPAVPVVVADSAADFSGTQGSNNWFYGYYNRSIDAVAGYQSSNFVAFPHNEGSWSADNYWNGVQWDWFAGNPPWDEIGRTNCHPNGINNGAEHWVIRRWVSKVSGTITVDWFLAKQNLGGSGTVGVTGRIFHNNTQRDTVAILYNNGAGTNRTVTITGVQVGDTIDIALDPTGPGGDTGDGSDGSYMSAVIRGTVGLNADIASSIESMMRDRNATAYIRIPFTATNVAALDFMSLRMKYDDGFSAYLNGAPLVSRNAPQTLEWNSAALSVRADVDALQFEEIDISPAIPALQEGANVLVIHGLNASFEDTDFLILPVLRASTVTLDPSARRYFAVPTPGAINGFGNTNLGPLLFDLAHTPTEPQDHEELFVTARTRTTFHPVASMSLIYRVMFGSEVTVPMFDDGMHHDGPPGDGLFGGTIPASAATPGQMVRYFVRSTDSLGNATRFPPYFPNTNSSPEYFGTVVHNPTLTNPLPVLHLFIPADRLNLANNDSAGRYACSVFYLGEFYDNCGINRHGQSSTGFPKKSYDIDFNRGYNFKWKEGEDRVDDINLLTTYPDKAKMRNVLSHETYRDAGSPYHFTVPIRVQTNGAFYGDWHIVENGDANFLERIGRDPNGALYKMYNTFSDPSDYTISSAEAEKKTRKNEGNGDLVALYQGLLLPGTNRINFMYDNMNVSEVVNKTAARNLTADVDCCHKNYYFYRDSDGTGEWEAFPWDVDLSFGRNWQGADNPATPTANDGCSCYWDTNMWAQNYVLVGGNNNFWSVLFNTPTTRQMYYRRLRTLMDELLQPTNTPPAQLRYEARISELSTNIGPDGQLDLNKWGTWGNGVTGPIPTNDTHLYQNVFQAAATLTTNFLPSRRLALYTRTAGNSGEIPDSQPTNLNILIGNIDFNPVSANQDEEYIQLLNTNQIAVDISGWKIGGAVEHTFQGGVVIPRTNSLYVAANKKAFRARTTAPRGGLGLYIEGQYEGRLSARGETIVLIDKRGQTNRVLNFPGAPSLPQLNLRITEIMYRPSPAPVGSPYPTEDFEYLELKNIGGVAMSLIGVHFTNGIDFTFTASSAVTNLLPGQSILLVKNIAAFTSRHGSGVTIAGVYGGNLENGGERIELLDATNEKILDFDYNNSWYPSTDGLGFSLVIVDENAPFNTWDRKESWRPSGREHGSPGQTDPPQTVAATILVNEVLTHTDTPLVDYIELYNPNPTDVNIGGWFLSDDFVNAKKYRIPANTMILAGSYLSFDEGDFNANTNLPTSFSFSAKGDEAYVFSGDGTNLTGFFHGYRFGAAENGVSFGRYHMSTGGVHFVAQSARTEGNTNAGPKVGPVVITEIMYHPPDFPGGVDNQDHEFIELYNLSNTNVPLFRGLSTWRIRGSIEFDFPLNVTLGPTNYAIVVSFHPLDSARATSFRSKYGLSGSVPLYGPYIGKLDNSSETVELYKPDPPEQNEVPYVLVEQVEYADITPWPAIADGIGLSLQRLQPSQYGDDAINWTAVGPNPGGPYPGGTPPTITGHPADQNGVVGFDTTFSVQASGPPPLNYQWFFNSNALSGATGPSLVLSNMQPSQGGTYFVIVFNGGGYVQSSNATLAVYYPASIHQHPTNVVLRGTNGAANFGQTFANATFSVSASSATPIRYQWQFNGVDIPGATNTSLVVSNATLADEGLYTAVVTDAVRPVESVAARLSILVNPVLTQQPLGVTVAAGSTVSFTVSGRGHPLPFGYRWRRNGLPFTFVSTNQTNFTLTLNNIATNNSGLWTVVVTNQANATGVISSNAYVTVVTPPTNQTVPLGASATFNVKATNIVTSSPTFQWRFDNMDISGATSNSYTVTNVQSPNLGIYSVVVLTTNLPVPAAAATFSATLASLQTGPYLRDPEVLGDGVFRARLEGTPSQMYAIESSRDLTNWTVLTNLTFTENPAFFVDPGSTNTVGGTNRFYRARELP